jgi:GTPase SAR1 family protein
MLEGEVGVCDLIVMRVTGNRFESTSATSSIISSLINLPKLQQFSVSPWTFSEPADCIRSGHWQRAGLVEPPAEVVSQGWLPVIKFLQAGPYAHVHELRLMLIGDGEVGKTSLCTSFKAFDHKADFIAKGKRTVGIDLSELVFAAEDGPAVHLQVCDFAGQEIYHLSHTLQFTRRCLYVLMWTTHKFSESNAAQALAVDDIVAPLQRWLQLLAANVPEANVVVVGTHCSVDPGAFDSVRRLVDARVKEETERLRFIAEEEAKATRRVVEFQGKKAKKLLDELQAEPSAIGWLAARIRQDRSLQACEQFVREVADLNPPASRSFRRKAQSLLEATQELAKSTLRLGRLHGVYDGSCPTASAAVARLKLVNERSYAVDSVDGVGVAELLRDIEATCRDKDALPFMGEPVPMSWLQVKEALKIEAVRKDVGDCVISVGDAAARVRNALQGQPGVDVDKARMLRDADIQRCLEFWSLLGRVFVYNGHFLRDVTFVIELMKPLVHHSVTGRMFKQEFCEGSFDDMNHCLKKLQDDAVLDHRLLPHFKSWASSSPEAQRSILKFFKESFMISDLAHGSSLGDSCCLVTARLCDSSNAGRQRVVAAEAAAIEADSEFFAVYSVPCSHIGLIAHMQAAVQTVQPSGMHLHVACSHSHVCVSLESGSRMKCSVSLRSLHDVFRSEKLGSFKEKVSDDTFSHAFVICSNDDGLFSFAARCVDAIMHCGAFSAHFECWLPVLPLHAQACDRAQWAPAGCDWAMVGSGDNAMRLSYVLCANSDAQVMNTPRRKLREVVPRRPPVFMSHTFIRSGSNSSGDGTGEFCQRLKDKLQERLVCTVWFDRHEMSQTADFIDSMKFGVAQASAFVVCLSPLYLTRPNCLRELMWAMDICEKDRSKVLRVIPTHPSVSYAGLTRIIDLANAGCAAHVILPTNDTDPKSPPLELKQLKAHRLSDAAVALMRRLTGMHNRGTNPEWVKLQPWLSDVEGENWEETSGTWNGPSEGKRVEMTKCFDALALDLQAAVLGDRHAAQLDWLSNVEDSELQSSPRSQTYTEEPDTALLTACFPRILRAFKEEEAVKLMLLGLRDNDVDLCMQHGHNWTRANTLDQMFRMAAHMSQVDFDDARKRLLQQQQLEQEQQQQLEQEQQQQLEQKQQLLLQLQQEHQQRLDQERQTQAFRRRIAIGCAVAAAVLLAAALLKRRRQ